MKYHSYIVLLVVAPALLIETKLPAQNTSQDSLRNYRFADETDIDTTINYQANRLETEADSKIIRLIGNAVVTYKDMTLRAGMITIDMNENSILAKPLVDSSTTATKSDGSALIGYPEFSEGGQRMVGEKMIFNFVTEKGRVIKGRTEFEEGFYRGGTLKKTSQEVFYIEGGVFTTCDLDTPHYHFSSNKMKMIQDDRVIARPIILYIHDIPIAALPYGFFPNQRGRRSGILVPRYGQSFIEGRYLRGLGYYWAASQYWDTKFEIDFFEKTGFMLHSTTNYALRYVMRGSLSGSLLNKDFGNESRTRRWDLSLNHSHTLSPTASLSARGSFVSDGSYYRDFSANRQQRLEREIRSNVTLSKNWPGSRNSMSINLFRSQNLDTDGITETFPQISFRHGQEPLVNLFRSKESASASGTDSQEKKWYENIYFSYSSQLLNRRSKFRSDESQPFTEEKFAGIEHTLSFSTPIRLFRYFTLSQNIGYEEIWQDRSKSFSLDPVTNEIVSTVDKGFAVRRTFDVRLGINTKFYGIFDINRLGIGSLRHVVTPSVSIQLRPDFSDEAFGYFVSVADTNGNVFKRDRFSGSFFGSTPSIAQRNVNFGLNNLFQMKTVKEGQERKLDLFSNSMSISHNFEADSLNWSRLSSSFRASPSRLFNFTLNMSHSLYQFDRQLGREVNNLLIRENILNPLRLTSLTLSSSLRINSTMFSSGERSEAAVQDSTAGELIDESPFASDRFERRTSTYGAGTKWSSNFSFSYSENRFNPAIVNKSIWLNLDSNIQLTKNWRVQYNARIDLKKKLLVAQDVSIYRDLHCWEARFVWTPTGPNKRFYLKINIKSALLSDIKIEKRGGRTTVYDF